MIKVYHIKDPKFFFSVVPDVVSEKDLHLVAEVDTNELNTAYQLTNTIDSPWWENDGVKFLGCHIHGMKGCRSSSVGDVFARTVGEGITRYFVVDRFGFSEVALG